MLVVSFALLYQRPHVRGAQDVRGAGDRRWRWPWHGQAWIQDARISTSRRLMALGLKGIVIPVALHR